MNIATSIPDPKDTEALRQGYSLPSHWYTDPKIFERERETIFRKNWLFFCHADEVSKPETYKAATVGTFPVVVTRTTSGELRGFLNICRHRLHKVVEEGPGCGKLLLCRYHAWSYDLDGKLRGLPRSTEIFAGDAEGFDKSKFGLLPVKVETWGPLVFVNLDLEAVPLMEAVGSLAGLADARGINFDTRHRYSDERTVAVNWKVFMDNVIECYHCPTVHPSLTEVMDTSETGVGIYCDAGRSSMTMQLREKKSGTPEQDNVYDYHAYFLPPTCFLSARASDRLYIFITEPVDVHHIRIVSHYCFTDDYTDEQVKTLVAAANHVHDEDAGVAVSVQRGHDVGNLPRAFLLPQSERQLREFADFVFRAVSESDTSPASSLG